MARICSQYLIFAQMFSCQIEYGFCIKSTYTLKPTGVEKQHNDEQKAKVDKY